MKTFLLPPLLLLTFLASPACAGDPLDQFPSVELEISAQDVMDTPAGQRVKALNDKMRKIAKQADELTHLRQKNSPQYLKLAEEHKMLKWQQQEEGKPISGLRGMKVVLYGTMTLLMNRTAVKQEVMAVYGREYAARNHAKEDDFEDYFRIGAGRSRQGPIKDNTLYAYYNKNNGALVVSHSKPDPAVLETPQGADMTGMVTITQQDIKESRLWKEKIGDLEERMEKLATDAAQHRGTESYELLMAGLAELKAQRDEHLKWFTGIDGINVVLYGQEAVMHKADFTGQAVYQLATSIDGLSAVINRTVYGWYDAVRDPDYPWIGYAPPQPKDIKPFFQENERGDFPPDENGTTQKGIVD
jgi:hypothetical protein